LDIDRICGGVEEGKGAAQSSHRCAGGNRLASGYFKSEGRRFCAHRERKETRPPHRGGQKAVVGGDEEALGGTPKEGSIKTSSEKVARLLIGRLVDQF